MKILWNGNVFNPTGIATANREMVKALLRAGAEVQCTDPWHDGFEFNEGLEHLNNAINAKQAITIFADYPQHWRNGFGRLIGHFLHEGTRLHQGWAEALNQAEKLFVPSQATKNLFKWNGVNVPMEVINFGTNPEIYKPSERTGDNEFAFLSVNSWTGEVGDRKGTDLLIKAFDEEFKDEDVKLILKIGTFWRGKIDYMSSIVNILGKANKNIIFNDKYIPEKDLATIYNDCDCFVAPTRGESFGLTIVNALACGLPVIVTNDVNSGHMDFCKGRESVLFVDAPERLQGDQHFFAKGNLLAEPSLESLKKQMRYAFENRDKQKELALQDSEFIRTNFTWDITAKKILEFLK